VMNFYEAQAFRMPFGKHKGKKLDDIAISDSGLLYLDWLFGEMDEEKRNVGSLPPWKNPVFEALSVYLMDDGIKEELQSIERD